VSLGDCTLALFQLDVDASSDVWGHHHDRPRVMLAGVRVPDLDQALEDLIDAGARILREAPGMLVLDPDTTADVEIAVIDQLLPGDPRV
jgi:hypothetical protein